METTQFWDIIEKSIVQKNSIDKNEQGDAILEILTTLKQNQILGFHQKLTDLKRELNTPQFNEIAFMMKYGDNRTALSGFKNWVISLGENHYKKTKQSPAHLLTLNDPKLFVVGRAYLNELDGLPQIAYEDNRTESDLEWYAFVQKHRRLQQIENNQNHNKDKGLER
ncbi:DUF4240 domain-containing protein [Polaribacter glomeratus]|uniref:DUF4240 domain-containing protein n=1 Tax=Polaribacter glomeratus TaxID=102 RepID=A0A2S7WGE1_9FLAO|nr:DUF4240 domain-containing protein [Polaribacter glomeratus]PQJ76486.1 hypothetical protein BTO16_11310 [Polaribacter glomeratus]TXD64217.1 DUF4240 domain-containing protein [Polaribacter glomeratus]